MTGLVKTLKTDDGKEIKLAGNAMTFILYKSYFGRDLLSDIISFAKANSSSVNLSELEKLGVRDLNSINSLDDAVKQSLFNNISSYKFDSEFVINFIASLMATAKYPEKVDIIDLIMEIPPYFVADKDIIVELMEFLSLFISQKKANNSSYRGNL